MIVLLDENEVAREKAQVGERLETVFTDQRAARNPQLWSAVSLRAAKVVRDVENRHAAKALIAWGDTSSGFAAHLDDSQVEALKSDPRVAAVFPDAIGYPAATDPAPWLNRPGFGPGYSFTYGWNLYAIGAINYFTDATPALNSPSYRTTGGYPVKAYVIDSGIQPHADLNFNWQVDHISFDAHANVDGLCNPDSNGVCQTTPTYSYLSTCDSHATHVAGIIGGIRQTGTPAGVEGVAPGASVVSVRVINYCQHRIEDQTGPNPKPSWEFPGLTYLSTVLSAIDWVKAKSAAAGGSSLRTGAVANMSILWDQGALTSTARTGLQTAITQAVNAGVFFAFAGGNSNQSACDLWPAKLGSSIAGAMTVGAMNNSGLPMRGIPGEPGKIASYGPCVEIWAPGQSVQSTGAYAGTVRGITYPVAPGAWWPGMPSNPSSTNVGAGQNYYYPITGSSMAAPHVAGAALLVLKKFQQAGQPLPSPAALEAYINTPTRLKAMGNYGGNPAPSGGPTWPVNMLQVNSY